MVQKLTISMVLAIAIAGCVENSAVPGDREEPCPDGAREVDGVCAFEGQIQIAPTFLQDARLDRPYTITFEATGQAPHTWTLGSGGQIPAGMDFDADTATLSGAPASPGTFSFTLSARDASGQSGEVALALSVIESDAPPACTPTGPEICDGIDNDCNGQIDEVPPDEACRVVNGEGSCPGEIVCMNGQPTCQGPMATTEVCDGIDNNCNGDIDENLRCDEASDIAVVSVDASRPENDNRVAVAYTLSNLGDAPSGPFTVAVQFSYGDPDGPFVPAGGMQNPGLAPGETQEQELITAARPQFEGELFARVVIDPESRTDDADRSNNSGEDSVLLGRDICPEDRFEPNQDFEGAGALGDGRYEDLQVCIGDEDWYLIQISEDNLEAPIEIRLLFEHNMGDIDAEIYSENGDVLLEAVSGDDDERLRFFAPRPGALRLRVFLFEQERQFLNTYTLEVARP